MRAMILDTARAPLQMQAVPLPSPRPDQVLLRVRACGVCRTDLHVVDGELDRPRLPLILGHEVVGTIVEVGERVRRFSIGDRVGVPWLAATDGTCRYCLRQQENLCDRPLFTGYTTDGGYADYLAANPDYCFSLPSGYSDLEAAPLLCAGLIGYRTYRLAGPNAEHVGIYGFGAAAHIIAQVAVNEGREVYAFTSPGDIQKQQFAAGLGVTWAGASTEAPPEPLDAAIIFAPAGSLVPEALSRTVPGGTVVCAGIHMSNIPAFAYRLLWEERTLRSVANLTRQDAREFFAVAAKVPIAVHVRNYGLDRATDALADLRNGEVRGAAVLLPADASAGKSA
jgi:alcohol dehydrogenase, propanol-preferring